MRLALRELRRRPGRFVVAGAILTLISVLLMFLGGLLDGLLDASTGAYRAQRADLLAYSTNARTSLVRSTIDPATRQKVAAVDGVEAVGGLGSLQVAARPASEPDTRDVISTALLGYELAPAGLPSTPPPAGSVYADSTVTASGVKVGDTLLLGPARVPVKVIGLVDDTRLSGQASLWGSLGTWRSVAQATRPGQFDDTSVQALVIRTSSDAEHRVIDGIDAATGGGVETLTIPDAIEALPGIAQQRSTFNQIMGATVAVALAVVGLFFALVTVERVALYGVLKAIGASNRTLFAGVAAQALTVTAIATAIGALLTVVLAAAIPAGSIPFAPSPGRVASSVVMLLVASLAGCAFSLRRVLRIDPTSAIGASS